MHPKMQSLWLSMTLALLSIWGLTVDCLSPFEASIVLAQLSDNNSRKVEADQLLNQGYQQFQTSQFQTALQSWQQALGIYKEIRDRLGEGQSLGNLGLVYRNLGNYPKAVEFHQQSLAIAREIGNRDGEVIGLNNLAFTLKKQNQPVLAIAFYKQAVNILEFIRKDLGVLPKEQQRSYIESVSNPYRNLADLLFQQNRVVEALQILDLLKGTRVTRLFERCKR
jgi:tetratricopeptide (TPR) repeat protein